MQQRLSYGVIQAMAKYQLIATAPMGLEAIVARELKQLGYMDQMVENGRVVFAGDGRDIARANLWLRTAGRVLVQLGQFPARTFDELFEGVKALDWPAWLGADSAFPVNGRSHKSQLSSVPACQGVVKKAIVEKLKQRYNTDWFPETGPTFTVEVTLLNDVATLTLDTSGLSLHKRGYRTEATEAPMRESLAAALVLLSRWQPHRPLYDPFCGSGTIAIEAALIARNIAPGARRSFQAESWPCIPREAWATAREEAADLVSAGEKPHIVGSDVDPRAIELARAAAAAAGVGGDVRFMRVPVDKLAPEGRYGCIVTNPPYGERIGSRDEVKRAIRSLGAMTRELGDWSVFAISPGTAFEGDFGRRADKTRKLFNGQIECRFYQYFGPLPPRGGTQGGE